MELIEQVSVEEVDLLDLELEEETTEIITEGMQFPCVLLEGIESEKEVRHFMKSEVDEALSLPLYMRFENVVKEVGKYELSLDYILKTAYISSKYTLTICKSENTFVDIDLKNPAALMNFIVL